MYGCLHTYMHAYTYIPTYIHAYIHPYIHRYVCMHACFHFRFTVCGNSDCRNEARGSPRVPPSSELTPTLHANAPLLGATELGPQQYNHLPNLHRRPRTMQRTSGTHATQKLALSHLLAISVSLSTNACNSRDMPLAGLDTSSQQFLSQKLLLTQPREDYDAQGLPAGTT